MKLLIIGAGRMGIRHAIGAISVHFISEVCITDISDLALENARAQLSDHTNYNKTCFKKIEELYGYQATFVIISTTAYDRIASCKIAKNCNPKFILIEKPVAQCSKELIEIIKFYSHSGIKVYVNLCIRLYPFIKELKKDLNIWPQFEGHKLISFSGGTIGIGANGIHYLDLFYYLFGASTAKLVYGEIDPTTIPSGRGANFNDYGGTALIHFFNNDKLLIGKAILNLSSTSTVFGGWDIIGSHGRIRINELECIRTNIIRKPESKLPINRYGADYLPPETTTITTPLLSDLTRDWIEFSNIGIQILPTLEESLSVHELMFEWLSKYPNKTEVFPIT